MRQSQAVSRLVKYGHLGPFPLSGHRVSYAHCTKRSTLAARRPRRLSGLCTHQSARDIENDLSLSLIDDFDGLCIGRRHRSPIAFRLSNDSGNRCGSRVDEVVYLRSAFGDVPPFDLPV